MIQLLARPPAGHQVPVKERRQPQCHLSALGFLRQWTGRAQSTAFELAADMRHISFEVAFEVPEYRPQTWLPLLPRPPLDQVRAQNRILLDFPVEHKLIVNGG